MDIPLIVVLVVLGFVGAFCAGMLGIGGATLMVPLLLYIPAAVGVGQLDMKVVAGISIVQVFFAALGGFIVHARNHYVSRPLVLWMGSASLIGAFVGAVASGWLDARALSAVFAGLLLCSLALMLLPRRGIAEDLGPAELHFNRPLAAASGLVVGGLAGMVGVGGAPILIAAMLYVLRIPTRIAIGSSLGIVFMSAIAGSLGKLGTGQTKLWLAAALVAGSLPGAPLGGRISRGTAPRVLRAGLTAVVALAAFQMWYDLIAR